jgi:broad specificity phosphatase PhoE
MSTLVFIRHGETNMAGRFCGHSDPELNAAGVHDAMRAAEAVSNMGVARIYSSNLRRASQTAAAIAQRTSIPVNYLPGLREIDFGLWERLTWQEIEIGFPEEAELWLKEFPLRSAPGGEPYATFTERVDATIADLLRETAGMTAAVVTHRGVMHYALTKFFGFAEAEVWTSTASYGAVVIASNQPYACEALP